jgi:undecaprenyl-phosphate 4-deoxy-4-formamido-L-arabinose transferase
MELSVVIPAYRSAAILPALVDRLLAVLKGLEQDSEIIFVEDCSPDDDATWDVLKSLQRAHPDRIAAIQLMRNFGQHNALMCGFRHARGDLIVTIDDDLQTPPEEIPKLVSAIRHGEFDLVYGTYHAKQHAGWRNLGSGIVNIFYRLVFETRTTITSFRVIRRELVESIFPYALNFTYIDGLLAWNTQRIGQVTVEHHARSVGRSGYSLKKLVILAFNLFTNFSLLPLQVVSALGFFAAVMGFLAALVVLFRYLISSITVPGYASIVISIMVMGGLQLMALGVMGEYLGRLHLNVNRKPQYTVRHVVGASTSRTTTAMGELSPAGPAQGSVASELRASSSLASRSDRNAH